MPQPQQEAWVGLEHQHPANQHTIKAVQVESRLNLEPAVSEYLRKRGEAFARFREARDRAWNDYIALVEQASEAYDMAVIDAGVDWQRSLRGGA